MKTIPYKILYRTLHFTLKWMTLVLFSVRIEGQENLPEKGPYIVAANHASFIDPIVGQIAVRDNISWVAKKAVYKKWFLRPIHYTFRSIPVNGAVDKAVDALEEGRVVGIFPEGTRSRDGKLKEADVGVAVMALKSGCPVVPVGISGAYDALRPGKVSLSFRSKVTTRIGKPFSFTKCSDEKINEPVLKEKTAEIMGRIRELLP